MASLKPRKKMLHDERIIKKRLGNPELWRQLEAISSNRWVNHLGRGHTRRTPAVEERAWEEKVNLAKADNCEACVYGNTAVFLHSSNCRYVS